jgi:nucleoside-diphosphate-sugar epimerase
MRFAGITLVTGAAGFMGSHVVEHLAGQGVKVRATSRFRADTSFFDNLGVEYVPADLTRSGTLPALFEGDVDRVFHLGAICNFSTPFEKLYPTNVQGVDRLTDLALEHKVKRFVHVTSTSVYGYYQGTPFKETDTPDPQDDYARSKKGGEDVLFAKIEKGLPAVVVRPPTVYGPRCNDGAGKVFSRPSKISAIPGNGKQLLANIRAEDVAAALVHISGLDEAVGEIYNVADDSNPTLEAALALAAKTYHTAIPKLHLPLSVIKLVTIVDGFFSKLRGKIPDIEYDATKYLYFDYVVDNTKIKKTGFSLKYPDFVTSMAELGDRFRAQGPGEIQKTN